MYKDWKTNTEIRQKQNSSLASLPLNSRRFYPKAFLRPSFGFIWVKWARIFFTCSFFIQDYHVGRCVCTWRAKVKQKGTFLLPLPTSQIQLSTPWSSQEIQDGKESTWEWSSFLDRQPLIPPGTEQSRDGWDRWKGEDLLLRGSHSPDTPPKLCKASSISVTFQTIVSSGRPALGKFKATGHKNKRRKSFEIVSTHTKGHEEESQAGPEQWSSPPSLSLAHSDFPVPVNVWGFRLFFL